MKLRLVMDGDRYRVIDADQGNRVVVKGTLSPDDRRRMECWKMDSADFIAEQYAADIAAYIDASTRGTLVVNADPNARHLTLMSYPEDSPLQRATLLFLAGIPGSYEWVQEQIRALLKKTETETE